MIALTLTPSVSVSCSRKSIWIGVNLLNDASSTTPMHLVLEHDGHDREVGRRRLAEP